MPKSKKQEELERQLAELTQDLQRTRADFENYRKRVEQEKTVAREAGQATTILKLLPVVDIIERAVAHVPETLKGDTWAQGIVALSKSLEKSLESLNLRRIDATKGTTFNPDLHEAIQFDEDATGDQEIIEQELQAGYTFQARPIRHSMVKVTRK